MLVSCFLFVFHSIFREDLSTGLLKGNNQKDRKTNNMGMRSERKESGVKPEAIFILNYFVAKGLESELSGMPRLLLWTMNVLFGLWWGENANIFWFCLGGHMELGWKGKLMKKPHKFS